MKYNYIDLLNKNNLIDGVVMHPLVVHIDPTGSLVETIREDWRDVVTADMPLKMQYMSVTPSAVARDEDKWHVHKFQKDRFICVSGRIVTAIYDPRENSKTKGTLNLFLMGPNEESEMYILIIPENTYHGFVVISPEEGYLLNFPTQLYNPEDEGRVGNNELSWKEVREDFGI